MMLLPLLLLQAAPVGVAPGPLPPEQATRRLTERFADLDLNEDGAIERDEVRARFDFEASADATLAAAQKAKKASDPRHPVDTRQAGWDRADAWFAATDSDSDRRVTRAELARAMGADVQPLGVR